MKKLYGFLIVIILVVSSCHKSTCPTFDKNHDGGVSGGGKTKSGLFPKKMMK